MSDHELSWSIIHWHKLIVFCGVSRPQPLPLNLWRSWILREWMINWRCLLFLSFFYCHRSFYMHTCLFLRHWQYTLVIILSSLAWNDILLELLMCPVRLNWAKSGSIETAWNSWISWSFLSGQMDRLEPMVFIQHKLHQMCSVGALSTFHFVHLHIWNFPDAADGNTTQLEADAFTAVYNSFVVSVGQSKNFHHFIYIDSHRQCIRLSW